MTHIEALKLALEALKQIDEAMPFPVAKLAQKAIKEALAQPEQEPYGWAYESHGRFTCNAHPIFWKTRKAETHTEDFWEEIPLYRHPPQRKPLTVGEIVNVYNEALSQSLREQDKSMVTSFARAIEAAHGIKGEA